MRKYTFDWQDNSGYEEALINPEVLRKLGFGNEVELIRNKTENKNISEMNSSRIFGNRLKPKRK